MARSAATDQECVARWKAARKRVKLGQKANQVEFAQIAGIHARTLRDQWIVNGLPVESRGTNGKDYQIDVKAGLGHMIGVVESKLKSGLKDVERMARIASVQIEDMATGPRDYREVRDAIRLAEELQRAQERQGRFVPASAMVAFITEYHATIAGELLGAPAKIDPTGQLPPDVREELLEIVTNLLGNLERKAQRFTDEHDASVQPGIDAAQRKRGRPRGSYQAAA